MSKKRSRSARSKLPMLEPRNAKHQRRGARDQRQPVLVGRGDGFDGKRRVRTGQGGARGLQRGRADVDRHVARRTGRRERREQAPGLRRAARAKLDERGAVRAEMTANGRSDLGEQRVLGTCLVVLRRLGDALEDLGAHIVVEEPWFERARTAVEPAGERQGEGQSPLLSVRRGEVQRVALPAAATPAPGGRKDGRRSLRHSSPPGGHARSTARRELQAYGPVVGRLRCMSPPPVPRRLESVLR